jgi:hypothetical protein
VGTDEGSPSPALSRKLLRKYWPVKEDSSMPKLWLVFGLAYILAAVLIVLDHFLRFNTAWRWDEALHHEAFFIATIWVAAAYLFVSLVEHIRGKGKKRP